MVSKIVNRIALIMLAVLVLFPLVKPVAARAVSFPFTCVLTGQEGFEIGTMVQGGAPPSGYIGINFNLSSGPASSGLPHGECAFVDRAVKPSEPHTLCVQATITRLDMTPDYGQQGGIGTLSLSGPGAATVKAAISGSSVLANFMVHAAGSCFIVDSYGV